MAGRVITKAGLKAAFELHPEPLPRGTMTADDHKSVRDVVHDYMGIDLTDAQLLELCSDPRIVAEVTEWGAYDTQTREKITAVLTEKIVGHPWPRYSDTKEYKEAFYADFEREAPLKGYRLIA